MKSSYTLVFLFLSLVASADEPDGKRHWVIPDHYQLQYAGNIGFLSGGFGYEVAKNKLELDFQYGYVPVEFGGPLNSITFKTTWIPFKPVFMGDVAIDFFTTGLVFNYSLGDEFFFIPSQEQYPPGYYDYSSALRTGIFVGGRLHWNLKNLHRLSFYYEIGTYDLALHNYVFNVGKSSFRGLFNLALGLKYYIDPLPEK